MLEYIGIIVTNPFFYIILIPTIALLLFYLIKKGILKKIDTPLIKAEFGSAEINNGDNRKEQKPYTGEDRRKLLTPDRISFDIVKASGLMLRATIDFFNYEKKIGEDYLETQVIEIGNILKIIKHDSIIKYMDALTNDTEKTPNAASIEKISDKDTFREKKLFELLFRQSFSDCSKELESVIRRNHLIFKTELELKASIDIIVDQLIESIKFESYDYIHIYNLNPKAMDVAMVHMEKEANVQLPMLINNAVASSKKMHDLCNGKKIEFIENAINELSNFCNYIDKDKLKEHVIAIFNNSEI